MARVYQRVGSTVTAQSSQAHTANVRTTAGRTTLSIASSGNIDGAQYLDVYVTVASGGEPSANASVEIYQELYDGSTSAVTVYALTGQIMTVAGTYYMGRLYELAQENKISVKPLSYGFTGACLVVPGYLADA